MRFDLGTAVIIVAVLLFYLRLILIQRQRAKKLHGTSLAKSNGKKLKGKAREKEAYYQLTLFSTQPRDWIIAGAGMVAVAGGILLLKGLLPWQAGQAYWWLPVAAGIVAFSWAFR